MPTPQIDDNIYEALGNLGYIGTITDRLAQFWADKGVYGSDAQKAYMLANGADTSIGEGYNDILYSFANAGMGVSLFATGTDAEGDPYMLIKDTDGNTIFSFTTTVSSGTSNAANPISDANRDNTLVTACSGRNRSAWNTNVCEMRGNGNTDWRMECATPTDVTTNGSMGTEILGWTS